MTRIFHFIFSFCFIIQINYAQNLPDLRIFLTEKNNHPKTDWLINPTPYKAKIFKSKDGKSIFLHNGLIYREIRLTPNAATVGFDNLMTGETIIRGVKPEGEITINGKHYLIGGLTGQSNYAFLKKEWIDELEVDSNSLVFKLIRCFTNA